MCNYPGPDVFDVVIRTARIEHKCCECRTAIQPRQKYEYVSGVWEGEWDHYKTCMNCAELRKMFKDDDGCYPPFLYLLEAYLEQDTLDNYGGLVGEKWVKRARESKAYREKYYG